MKKKYTIVVLLSLFSFVIIGIISYFLFNFNENHPGFYLLEKPLLEKNAKHRDWSSQEAFNFSQYFNKIRQIVKSSNANSQIIAGGSLSGVWKSRGPFNIPGAFQYCEMDDGTDTVYAVTCGHYAGVQFIWKGTLWGNSWKLINPKHPSRFRDLMVVPNGNKRRVIAAHQKGGLMYSDDSGKNWVYSTGLPSALSSTIVNKQDNNKIYTTDGKKVYVSTNLGTSFSEFQTIGVFANQSCLYSPRYNVQPNASDVYLVVDNKSFKLLGGAFTQLGESPIGGWNRLGGDSRKLWLVIGGKNWYYSTNGGATWIAKSTIGTYYNSYQSFMDAGEFPGVCPTDPNILIGGFTIPVTTRDAGTTANVDAKNYWGKYQLNSLDNTRWVNFHPDFQASQFFYDKNGDMISLRSSDGGVFISYDEWTKTSYPTYNDILNVYRNITLYGCISQEGYSNCFTYGAKNINDMSSGTQDQGNQVSRLSTYSNNVISWDFIWGGDGSPNITGNGLIGWTRAGQNKFQRFNLYDGNLYKGVAGIGSKFDVNVSPWQQINSWVDDKNKSALLVCDWDDGETMWLLAEDVLRRVKYDNVTGLISGLEHNLTNSINKIQGIAQSRVNPKVIYAMENGYIFKSTNRGDSFFSIASKTATGIVNTVAIGAGWSSPADEKVVLFAIGDGTSAKSIFSKDGGISWIDVTGTGENRLLAGKVLGIAGNESGSLAFAATDLGPYVFVVADKKWYPMITDETTPLFKAQMVYCMKFGEQEVVRFSTWGSGVWDFMINPALETLYVMKNGSVAIKFNVYTELDSVIFNNLDSPLDSMSVMKNGAVIDKRNLTEEVDSLIFYKP